MLLLSSQLLLLILLPEGVLDLSKEERLNTCDITLLLFDVEESDN